MQAQPNTIFFTPVHDTIKRLDSRQFDLIYIDPPYFNQGGFDQAETNISYRYFQEYLEYIVFVILHSKRLLKDTGSVLFRMDPASPYNSRLFLDRIFGKQNYRAEVIFERRVVGSKLPTPHLNYDSVFFYSKSDKFTYHELQGEDLTKNYRHYDDQGFYKLWPLTAPINRPNMIFPWRDRKPPQNSSWKYSVEKLEQLAADGKIDWGGKFPRLKVYRSEKSSNTALGFVWRDNYSDRRSNQKIDSRIQDIINMTSNPEDIIFDPFITPVSINSFRYSGRSWAGISLHNGIKLYNKSKSHTSNLIEVNNIQDFDVVDGDRIPSLLSRLIVSEARAFDNTAASEISGQRFALLVGINNYRDGIDNLQYCINDVLALEQVLKDSGYQVKTLHDDMEENDYLPLRSNIDAELNNLVQSISSDDTLFVHFSCHGTLIDNEAVLITSDTRHQRLRNSALFLKNIIETMKAGRAGKLVLSLDVCHAGVDMGRALIDQEFISNVYDKAEGFVLLAASTAQQQAYELPEYELGLYSHYLIEGLKGEADLDDDGRISVEDVRNFILNSIRRWNSTHHNRQEPTYRNEGIGEILLISPRTG